MLSKQIETRKTAHYFTLGTPSPNIQQFWIVCHGYAQCADDFMQNFTHLDDGSRFLVAPEGFNLFYQKGFAGTVVANWMTSRFRESQIEDYCHFLDAVYQKYRAQLPDNVQIVLLGFSQGTATVCRWIMQSLPHFHHLLLWAGLPPEDLNYAAQKDYLANKNLYLLYGTSDPYLTPDRMASMENIENQNQIDFQETSFEGGHEIPKSVLLDFLKKLN